MHVICLLSTETWRPPGYLTFEVPQLPTDRWFVVLSGPIDSSNSGLRFAAGAPELGDVVRGGENAPEAKVLPGSTTSLLVVILGPNALKVTVTNPDSAGFVTVFPCGQPVPIASNLNFAAGQTVASAVIAAPGQANTICFYSSAATDILVDAMGSWLPAGYAALSAPRRALDTRKCSYAVYREENKILSRDRAVRTRVKTLATGTDREIYSLSNYGKPVIGHDCYSYAVADVILSTPTPLAWTAQRTIERFNPDTGLSQTVFSETVSASHWTTRRTSRVANDGGLVSIAREASLAVPRNRRPFLDDESELLLCG